MGKAEEDNNREDREDDKDGRNIVQREGEEGQRDGRQGKRRTAKGTHVPRPRYERRERTWAKDVSARIGTGNHANRGGETNGMQRRTTKKTQETATREGTRSTKRTETVG